MNPRDIVEESVKVNKDKRDAERMKSLGGMYQKASGELRRRHHAEFRSILSDMYKKEGVVVRTRRSKAELWAQKVADAKEVIAEEELSK